MYMARAPHEPTPFAPPAAEAMLLRRSPGKPALRPPDKPFQRVHARAATKKSRAAAAARDAAHTPRVSIMLGDGRWHLAEEFAAAPEPNTAAARGHASPARRLKHRIVHADLMARQAKAHEFAQKHARFIAQRTAHLEDRARLIGGRQHMASRMCGVDAWRMGFGPGGVCLGALEEPLEEQQPQLHELEEQPQLRLGSAFDLDWTPPRTPTARRPWSARSSVPDVDGPSCSGGHARSPTTYAHPMCQRPVTYPLRGRPSSAPPSVVPRGPTLFSVSRHRGWLIGSPW